MSDISIGRLRDGLCVYWYEDGKRRRFELEARTRAAAESEAIAVYRRETAKTTGTTVKELWDAYRKDKEGRRVADAMKHEWKAIGPHFGALAYDQVSVETCRAYTAKRRAAGIGDGTIWTELGHLRSVFRWAWNDARLIKYAPKIERPKKPEPKDRWLNDREIEKLLAAPGAPHIDLAVILMLSTAGRVGAILELTWDRVDFEAGIIDLKTNDGTKRKGRATVPMNNWSRAALQTAKKLALTDYVIEWGGKPVKSIKKGFGLKVKASGLEDVTPHVLRHTAAVVLVSKGVPLHKVGQYLGHTDYRVTERVYGRFAPDHMRQEAEILDFGSFRKKAG